MTPERFREIDQVFQEAAELGGEERAAFLDRACGDDAELRREVESLLEHDTADTNLERSVREVSASVVSDRDPERLGPYRVTGVIGRGGMGVVYAAVRDDDVYRKQVAVKLVKRGMDTDFVLERFKSERRILARLEHPNIAQLLDGGSADDGRPYFVMEHIQGQAITEYCETKGLPVAARLRLFLSVCSAVQHAHQNMVVHRDLKPSNILVTADGTVKLLDFGIAKALQGSEEETAEQTALGLRMMTPGYASPEQVLGQPVTTATDVYSLGAVLYEVLAGTPPHPWRGVAPAEVERAICERQPPAPSTVAPKSRRKSLAGDLDNIVLMALRKEPPRRYATADQLAEDLRRAMENRPVRARADTFGYRAGKFMRRNRIPLAAATVLAASLVGGIAVSVWQARRAERRFELARKLAGTLIYDVHDEIRDLAGATRARQKIVSTGLEYLGALEREAAGDPKLQWDLASAYLRIGDVQGGSLGSNLGDPKGALQSYRKARALLAGMRVTAETTLQVAAMQTKIGDVLTYHGDVSGALETYREAQSLVEPLAQRPGVAARKQLAVVLQGVARAHGIHRNVGEALAASMKALELRRELAASEGTQETETALAEAEAEVSMSLQRVARPGEALPHARKALEIRLAQAAEQRNNAAAQRGLILSYSHVADVLGNPTMPSLGDTAGAIEMYRKMTAVAEELAAADPSDRRARYDLANCLLRLGSALLSEGSRAEALATMKRSAALLREIAAAEPKNNRARSSLVFLYLRIGEAIAEEGSPRAAMESFAKAIELGTAVMAAAPDEQAILLTLAQAYGRRGLALAALGDRSAAVEAGTREVETVERLVRENPQNPRLPSKLAESYYRMAQIERKLAGVKAAGAPVCGWLEKARATYPKQTQGADSARVEAIQRELAACAGR